MDNDKSYQYIIGNYIFVVALLSMIFSCFLESTTIPTVFPIFKNICYALEIFSVGIASIKLFFLSDYSVRYKLIILMVLFILYITATIGKSRDLLDSFILVFASVNIKLENIFKTYFYLFGTGLFVVITLSQTGILPNYVYFNKNSYRQSLGMGYTTILSSVVFYLLVALVCWSLFWKNKHSLLCSIPMFGISYFIYKLTNTRTDLICSLLLILLFLISNSNFAKFNFSKTFLMISPSIIFLWSLYSTYFYNNMSRVWLVLNDLFSERLYLNNLVSNLYPAKLFGQYFTQYGNGYSTNIVTNYLFIDSSFLRVYFMNGIIPFIILYLIIQYSFYRIIKSGNNLNILLLFIFLITAFEGIFSTLFLVIGINCTLYILNYVFFNQGRISHSEEIFNGK
ncbi:hypothetical protein PWJ57_05490 [Fructilactobacillus sanfranciscensis]|uniref:hypothetical protein n=1 Tax=Fructilactobacillus sanfranciscensis TaxID=1625 RepID=UPI0031FA08C8